MFPSKLCCLRCATVYLSRRNFCNGTTVFISDASVKSPATVKSPNNYDVEHSEQALEQKTTRRLSGGMSLVDRCYFTSRSHLTKWISSNVVHEDEMLLAVNKLPGTPVFGSYQSAGVGENNEDENRPVTIVNILPELRHIYGCAELDIALGNPRYHSGVVILSKNEEAKKRIQKCIKTTETQKQPHLKYLVITHGFPASIKDGPEEMGFTRQRFGERVLSVKVDKSRRSARQKGEEIVTAFTTSPLAASTRNNCALLQMTVNKAKWDCIETYLTEKLCSVLGDHLYSGRVNTVLGLPVYVQPNMVKQGTQNLSRQLKRKLGIHDDDLHHLPLHLHRHQVELTNFPTKQSSPLMITAPLPDYFKATLDKLQLHPNLSWNI